MYDGCILISFIYKLVKVKYIQIYFFVNFINFSLVHHIYNVKKPKPKIQNYKKRHREHFIIDMSKKKKIQPFIFSPILTFVMRGNKHTKM